MSRFLKAIGQSLWYPREVHAMIKFKNSMPDHESPLTIAQAAADANINDVDFAYLCLHKVSRSFAVVIQLLDPKCRDAICLFYLILRGLDSVEDDMTYPIEKRVPLLRCFHEKLEDPNWNIEGVGDSDDYRALLAAFDKVTRFYQTLEPIYKEVIKDITMKMGAGMADFAEKYHGKKLAGVDTVEEYELYCHYVAGLVGLGLDRLFVGSGLEDYNLEQSQPLANSMGLFLQKVNITRDYLEDIEMDRSWWAKEIWGKYSDDLEHFKNQPHSIRSRLALNNMILNALKHVPDVIQYMSKLRDPTIFNFCAIPQVMAISTLALLYNNTTALTETLKIRRGIVCDVTMNCKDLSMVKGFFQKYLEDIDSKLVHPSKDSFFANATEDELKLAIELYNEYKDAINQGFNVCEGYYTITNGWSYVLAPILVGGAAVAASYIYNTQQTEEVVQ
eukprot:UN01072